MYLYIELFCLFIIDYSFSLSSTVCLIIPPISYIKNIVDGSFGNICSSTQRVSPYTELLI